MANDPSTVTIVIPGLAALVSVAGAVYVGYQNRRLTREMAQWQTELADAVVCEQLWLALASRARYVGGALQRDRANAHDVG